MSFHAFLRVVLLAGLLTSPPAWAEINTKVVVADATYVMGDADTLAGAEENALLRAKRQAVEEVGVYIEASSEDIEKHADGKTARLNSLSIRTIAAAITETVILEKRRAFENERPVFYVKIKATVSLDALEDAIKRQKAYEQLAEHHRQLHAEHSQLKSELDELRKRLRESRTVLVSPALTPRNRRAAAGFVHAAVQSHDLTEKINLASKAIAADDQYVDAYVVRGQTYLTIASLHSKKSAKTELNDYVERAIADFDRALSLDQASPWALMGRGDALTWQKKTDDALKDYERILHIDPLFDVAKQRLITLRTAQAKKHVTARQWRQALATLNQLLQADTAQSWVFHEKDAYLLRGQVFAELGQMQQAVEDFTTVLRVDPSNRQALLSRAKLYERLQQPKPAKEDFDRACSLGSEEACLAVAQPSKHLP